MNSKNIKKIDVDSDIVGLIGSVGAFVLGVGLLVDDAKDLGEFSSERHPSPLHHWQYSIPIMLGGTAGILGFGARVLQKADHIRKNNK